MSGLHTPERQPHETRADYRKRQRASRRAVQATTLSRVLRDQRNLLSSRQQLRDAQRSNGKGPRGTFADAIGWNAARKRADLRDVPKLRDEHGVITLTGAATEFVDCKPDSRWYELGGSSGPDGFTKIARRIWLAGISAQRGYW